MLVHVPTFPVYYIFIGVILIKFQVCSIVIRHLHAHHLKSNFLPLPHIWTTFPSHNHHSFVWIFEHIPDPPPSWHCSYGSFLVSRTPVLTRHLRTIILHTPLRLKYFLLLVLGLLDFLMESWNTFSNFWFLNSCILSLEALFIFASYVTCLGCIYWFIYLNTNHMQISSFNSQEDSHVNYEFIPKMYCLHLSKRHYHLPSWPSQKTVVYSSLFILHI